MATQLPPVVVWKAPFIQMDSVDSIRATPLLKKVIPMVMTQWGYLSPSITSECASPIDDMGSCWLLLH